MAKVSVGCLPPYSYELTSWLDRQISHSVFMRKKCAAGRLHICPSCSLLFAALHVIEPSPLFFSPRAKETAPYPQAPLLVENHSDRECLNRPRKVNPAKPFWFFRRSQPWTKKFTNCSVSSVTPKPRNHSAGDSALRVRVAFSRGHG